MASGRALILTQAGESHTAAWVRRGIVAAHVLPLPGWTGVVAAEDVSRAGAPYDDADTALLSHAGDGRTRPLVGIAVDRHRAVLSLQRRSWHPVPRWLVWSPRHGLLDPPGLRRPAPAELLRVTGADAHGVTPGQLRGVLESAGGSPEEWADAVLDTLGLPGAAYLLGESSPALAPHARLVEPTPWAVDRFTALVREDEDEREERIDER